MPSAKPGFGLCSLRPRPFLPRGPRGPACRIPRERRAPGLRLGSRPRLGALPAAPKGRAPGGCRRAACERPARGGGTSREPGCRGRARSCCLGRALGPPGCPRLPGAPRDGSVPGKRPAPAPRRPRPSAHTPERSKPPVLVFQEEHISKPCGEACLPGGAVGEQPVGRCVPSPALFLESPSAASARPKSGAACRCPGSRRRCRTGSLCP